MDYDLNCGCYGAKWGLSDFYDESENKLHEILDSDGDFTADWGCKKEIRYGQITRVKGNITVRCEAHIDEIDEAIDTLVWSAMGGNTYAGSGFEAIAKFHDLDTMSDEEKITQIMEECATWIQDVYTEIHAVEGPIDTTIADEYDAVIFAIEENEAEAQNDSKRHWDELIEIVKANMDAIAEQNNASRELAP